MRLHPVAALLPPLNDAELGALRGSIVEHGVLDPVVVDPQERIVDGRHRVQIAEELGLDYPTRPLPDDVSPWSYGLTANLDRRHLRAEQRAAIVLQAEREGRAPEVVAIRERAAANQGARTDLEPRASASTKSEKSSDEIGALVGVSGATVRNVERAARESPDALSAIAAGETTARKVVSVSKNDGSARDETRPDPFLEMPCPACGRWTPQWVLAKMPTPKGATWRALSLRGSGKTRRRKAA